MVMDNGMHGLSVSRILSTVFYMQGIAKCGPAVLLLVVLVVMPGEGDAVAGLGAGAAPGQHHLGRHHLHQHSTCSHLATTCWPSLSTWEVIVSASLQGAGQGAGREVRVSTLLLGEGQCRKEPFSRSTEASSPHSCSRATWTHILNIYFDRLFRCI